jgi:hypothetical protein
MAGIAVMLLAGCSLHGLSFVQDKRLTILAPAQRSTVTLPVTLRWKIRDFHITGPTPTARPNSGYFALFVDRAPVPGGEPISSVAHGDPGCRTADGCPNAAYFTAHDVYLTAQTRYVLTQLPNLTQPHQAERHTITIVLLDGIGHRVSESGWSVTVTLHREDS